MRGCEPEVRGVATYKLARQLGGCGHYAEVTVTAEFSDEHSVRVSPGAFAWLRDIYGPDAWTAPKKGGHLSAN